MASPRAPTAHMATEAGRGRCSVSTGLSAGREWAPGGASPTAPRLHWAGTRLAPHSQASGTLGAGSRWAPRWPGRGGKEPAQAGPPWVPPWGLELPAPPSAVTVLRSPARCSHGHQGTSLRPARGRIRCLLRAPAEPGLPWSWPRPGGLACLPEVTSKGHQSLAPGQALHEGAGAHVHPGPRAGTSSRACGQASHPQASGT